MENVVELLVDHTELGDIRYSRIDGDVWKAVTQAGKDIPTGTKVKVVGRESIIITVEIV